MELTVYPGRANESVLAVLEDARPYDLDAHGVTHVQVRVGERLLDSRDHPQAIAWEGHLLRLRLGLVDPPLVAGWWPGRVVLFAQDAPDGVVWSEIGVQVK